MYDHTTILKKWKEHDFYAPDTVVLGLDIGIEGIGIAVRKGTELVYCKTLLVDLPEAKALAQRRLFRASRHARKNYRVRMRRLQQLFAKHDLPWVGDDIYSRSDPFVLRHRAVKSKLASKEALSLCIRSCVARRGYDYFALTGKGSGEYPWGETLEYTEAVKWIRSTFLNEQMREYLLGMTTELRTKQGRELDKKYATEWVQLIEDRYAKAEQEGIESMLHKYVHTHLNDRKYKGLNYPRVHVEEHLRRILERHKDMIADYPDFIATLFQKCETKQDKKHAIFHYNRKTPRETTLHFKKKVKTCPYCSFVDLEPQRCGIKGDKDILLWKLVDFLSNRTFDIERDELITEQCVLPELAVKAVITAAEYGCNKWSDVKNALTKAIQPAKLAKSSDWNKIQLKSLKDICAPSATARKGLDSTQIVNVRRKQLADFLSKNTFDISKRQQESWRRTLPEPAVAALIAAIKEGYDKWVEIRKNVDEAMSPIKLTIGSDWNKAQLEHLKDICTPSIITRKGSAGISPEAAKALFDMATHGGHDLEPAHIEAWKKEWKLYEKRAQIDAVGGIYPQVRALLGTLRICRGKSSASFATTGFLQRVFADISRKIGGKTVPDYCVIECIKNPAVNAKQAAEILADQKKNRQRKLQLREKYKCDKPTPANYRCMQLFEEQGGTPEIPALCPFTGEQIHSPLEEGLELAHLYPDSRGGLYISENLVLTKRKTNADMADRTPREAAAAGLENWLSWREMVKQSSHFKWSDKKRELFAFEPTADCLFPDFNNMTRTAQLARELRRLVAVWMGVDKDTEATRIRIGNPSGSYTAAARRSMLWPGYTKDRSNNLHHRLDAAVMTCIPPAEGLNDVCYGGIFFTDKSKGDRILKTLKDLPQPDFYAMWNDASSSPVVKKQSRSKSKSLGDSTFWSVDKENKTHQRTKLDPAKMKKDFKASSLYQTLMKMGISSNRIPSEKELQRWLIDCQAATKADATASVKPLRLKMSPNGRGKGVQVKNVWKFGSKGNLDNSPLGWSGIITDNDKFDQLRSLDGSCDRLEIWLGWNGVKWEYFKRNIPTAAAMAGFKRLGFPWRGIKNAPRYLLELLQNKKKKDLKELVTGTVLPPHAVKVATFRKGDVFFVDFDANQDVVNSLRKKDKHFKEEEHPKTIRDWGRVSAIQSDLRLEFSCLTLKDRSKTKMGTVADLAELANLPNNPAVMAQRLLLSPPA